jgi:aryl-alcohol dehydrogenase-like predicted oxidoreductase
MMSYRQLGRTDLNVSLICLGTMNFGEQNTQNQGFEQMDYALDQGINFFDTAELYAIPPKRETYGATESIIGEWFKARRNRDKVILATKVVGRSGMNWTRAEGKGSKLNRTQMTEALEGSLRRLQTDYIDLYQVHWPDRDMPWGSNPTIFNAQDFHNAGIPLEETLEVLSDFVKAGKVRHIGISNESAWGTMRYLELSAQRGWPRMASIQNVYSLVSRTFEVALAEIAIREDVGLLAYSPLAQGYLTGKYRHGNLPDGSRKQLFNRMQRYETPAAGAAIEAYLNLAEQAGLDAAQMALAFVNSRPFVTSNIIGATTIEQLKINIASAELILTEDVEQRINAIHQLFSNPCP